MPLRDVNSLSISSLCPVLGSHGGLETIDGDTMPAGYLKYFQKNRRKQYQEQGVPQHRIVSWENQHHSHDWQSYYLVAHREGGQNQVMQLRYFGTIPDDHQSHLNWLRREKFIRNHAAAQLTDYVKRHGYTRFFELSHGVEYIDFKPTAAVAYACALCRLFEVPFAYIICRIDTGLAQTLEEMGAERVSCAFYSDLHQGEVRIMGLRARMMADQYEDLIMFAQIHLQAKGVVYAGQFSDDGQKLNQQRYTIEVPPGESVRVCVE
ncbi:hypothetical protein NT6N_05210 [Oceaniferula spumae]|uniref:Uncharacterized protein n=1 Tax=Oceaniferula spumae TaxID=2979115 RepID=A0AAT9FHL2_9BACT